MVRCKEYKARNCLRGREVGVKKFGDDSLRLLNLTFYQRPTSSIMKNIYRISSITINRTKGFYSCASDTDYGKAIGSFSNYWQQVPIRGCIVCFGTRSIGK